jgi:hypothetical protein
MLRATMESFRADLAATVRVKSDGVGARFL